MDSVGRDRQGRKGKEKTLTDCENCKYALWDYETDDSAFDDHKAYEWYVSGCRKGIDLKDNCEHFMEKEKRKNE